MYECVYVYLCTYVRTWVGGGGLGNNVDIHKMFKSYGKRVWQNMVNIFMCVGRRDTCVCEGIAGRIASGRFLCVLVCKRRVYNSI